jgi:hypothetical protein
MFCQQEELTFPYTNVTLSYWFAYSPQVSFLSLIPGVAIMKLKKVACNKIFRYLHAEG